MPPVKRLILGSKLPEKEAWDPVFALRLSLSGALDSGEMFLQVVNKRAYYLARSCSDTGWPTVDPMVSDILSRVPR